MYTLVMRMRVSGGVVSSILLGALGLVAMLGCGEEPGDPGAVVDAEVERETTPPPDSPEALIARAQELVRYAEGPTEDLDEAKRLLVRALAKDRDNAAAYVELALIEMKGGGVSGETEAVRTRLANANKLASRAVELDPSLADAHHVNSRVRFYLGFEDLAAESIDQAEALGLDPGEVAATRSLLALRRGDRAESLRLARETVENESSPGYARLEMALHASELLRSAGYDADALGMAERAIEIVPDSALAHLTLTARLLDRGELERAIEHVDEAMEIGPESLARGLLTHTYAERFRELHHDSDTEGLQRLVEQYEAHFEGGGGDALEALGDSYVELWRSTRARIFRERARGAYRRALEQEPDRTSAARSLDAIDQF